MLDNNLAMILLWILAATGMFLFARWILMFTAHLHLPSDMRAFVFVGFMAVVGLAVFSFLWKFSGAGAAPPTPTPVTAPATPSLAAFEQANYPEFYGIRTDMESQLQTLNQFFAKDVYQWVKEMPAQRAFLQKLVDIRWPQRQALQKAYKDINQSRLTFWLYYKASPNEVVRGKFDAEVQRLTQNSKDALGNSSDARHKEEQAWHDHLDEAITLLQQAKITKPKVGLAFRPYAPEESEALHQWLMKKQESDLLIYLGEINQNEQLILERVRSGEDFQSKNPNVSQPAQEFINDWKSALEYNQYARYRILFAVEIIRLAGYLQIPAEDGDLLHLQTQLGTYAPQILQQAHDEILVAEHSYQPKSAQKYR